MRLAILANCEQCEGSGIVTSIGALDVQSSRLFEPASSTILISSADMPRSSMSVLSLASISALRNAPRELADHRDHAANEAADNRDNRDQFTPAEFGEIVVHRRTPS